MSGIDPRLAEEQFARNAALLREIFRDAKPASLTYGEAMRQAVQAGQRPAAETER